MDIGEFVNQMMKMAFNSAREGKTVGGIGGVKEYTYKDFEEYQQKMSSDDIDRSKPLPY